MNGLRTTNESGGMQALTATSSRIPQLATTTTTLNTTDSSNAGRRKDSPAQEHAETRNDVTK